MTSHRTAIRTAIRGTTPPFLAALALAACSETATLPDEPLPMPTAAAEADGSTLFLEDTLQITDDGNSHQVIVTRTGAVEEVLVTFEGGGHVQTIHAAEGFLIPGSGMRFPGWVTATFSRIVTNVPSPVVFALPRTTVAEVGLDDPAAEVRFQYLALRPHSLAAYAADGGLLATVEIPVNCRPAVVSPCGSWDPVTVSADEDVIARIVITSDQAFTMAVDDLVAVHIIALPVAIDIKPGSDPNCFKNDGHGVIPVAVLGAADFDVARVDPATVMLEGMGVRVAGRSNRLQASYEEVNGDAFTDLVVQIEDMDGVFESGDGVAELTGALYDGTPIVGSDTICIVP